MYIKEKLISIIKSDNMYIRGLKSDNIMYIKEIIISILKSDNQTVVNKGLTSQPPVFVYVNFALLYLRIYSNLKIDGATHNNNLLW